MISRTFALAAAALVAATVLIASPAVAAPMVSSSPLGSSPGGIPASSYKVINMHKYPGSTNYSQRLTYCQVGTSGATCTISSSWSATRTIGLDLGVTRSVVAAGLSISSSGSKSVSVSCTSPVLNAGDRWSAYPKGSRYTYQVRKTTTYTTPPTSTSGVLNAFDPDGGVYCTS